MIVSKRINLLCCSLACAFALALYGAFLSVQVTAVGSSRPASRGGISVTTVASNLHNPRGLNFAPDGSLYVAEAGGDGVASQTQCGVMGDGSTKCFATTGSVTRIDLGAVSATRVLTNLPSLISPNGTGNGATGVHDISFQGLGNIYVTMGLGGNPTLRESYFGADGQNFSRLGRFNPSGRFRLHENLGDYEAANNPDGFVPDSNPYGLLALPGRVIIADAGGNDLLQVSARGVISTLAVFPPVPRPTPGPPFVQAVPTSVALGPDGDFYVGVLTGGPFTVGLANVYRVPAGGGLPVLVHAGFALSVLDEEEARQTWEYLELEDLEELSQAGDRL